MKSSFHISKPFKSFIIKKTHLFSIHKEIQTLHDIVRCNDIILLQASRPIPFSQNLNLRPIGKYGLLFYYIYIATFDAYFLIMANKGMEFISNHTICWKMSIPLVFLSSFLCSDMMVLIRYLHMLKFWAMQHQSYLMALLLFVVDCFKEIQTLLHIYKAIIFPYG